MLQVLLLQLHLQLQLFDLQVFYTLTLLKEPCTPVAIELAVVQLHSVRAGVYSYRTVHAISINHEGRFAKV